jgi:outer membrane protein assembly factor BamB
VKKILAVSAMALASAGLLSAQIGKTFDWYTAGGDPERTNFEKSDTKFTKDDVKDFKLVMKHKLEGSAKHPGPLTAPVVLGTLVSYRGFKELAFVANETGDVWALDVDLDRVFWERHVDTPKTKIKPSAACPGGITAQLTMMPGVSFSPSKRRKGPPQSRQDRYKQLFAPRALFLFASDGQLYRLDTSTGKDMNPPVPITAAGAYASDLNTADGVVYTSTSGGCGGAPNAVWAVDLSGDKPKVSSFTSPAPEGFVRKAGVALNEDGEVFAQTSNTLQALSPKELKLDQTFSAALGETSPVVFTYKDRDLVVTAAKNGSLYLLDTKSMFNVLYQTSPIAAEADRGLIGLSTWETEEGTRYVLAAVSGALPSDLKAPMTNGEAPNGSIVAFKLTEQDSKPVLTPAWVSRDLPVPETPVIANGVVFALSAGEPGHKGKLGGHATLYGFDGETGKEVFSTGDQVTSPANLTGLTMANGRVFFTTADSTLYAFGYGLEH